MGTQTITASWLDELSQDMDLRKKRQSELTDRIIQRAHWLEPNDRELILAMFRDGQTANSLGQLLNQHPRLIRRRIKKLVSRLSDPRVAYVVAHHQSWSKTRRAIAQSLFIQGRSIREVTDELGVSFYSVRKHREAISAMCQAAPQSPPYSQLRSWR